MKEPKVLEIVPVKNSGLFNYKVYDEKINKTYFVSEISKEQLIKFVNENPNSDSSVLAEELIESQFTNVYLG